MPVRVLPLTRRTLIRRALTLGSGAFVACSLPWPAASRDATASPLSLLQAAATDPLEPLRANMAGVPIEALELSDTLTMLSGPGGNVLVLNGGDGKVLVDGFVRPAWNGLTSRLDALGPAPVTLLIDTHWHFDHADNNANARAAGADVLAHANTTRRLSAPQDLLGMKVPASAPEALPTRTFTDRERLDINGETLELEYVPPAHTDTDITVRCQRANVLHLGDLFFNGVYPVIDLGSRGSVGGMIAAAERALGQIDSATKIVPGHGPLADKAALAAFRDMLATVRDRVTTLKDAGRTAEEAVAARPTAEFDAAWGNGFMKADPFVTMVYNSL